MIRTKKWTALMVAFLLIVSSLFFLGGCVMLSAREQKIYDCIIANINDFYDPASVRVLEVGNYFENEEDDDSARIKIQAKNKFGGTVTDIYFCMLDDKDMYDLEEISNGVSTTIGITADDIDCGKINKKIKEYIENLGL